MIARFRKALFAEGLLKHHEGVLVAVSGGPDSVCLLHLFLHIRRESGLRLAVAHYNHRLRGRSSDADAAFVRRLAGRLGLPFVLGSPAGPPGRSKTLSLQEAARKERISFLLATARKRSLDRVALAHTADDQSETFLMRILTEGGPAGLGGIPPSSHGGRIIHPLLAVRRREIEAYCAAGNIVFRQDRSNLKPVYLRNRIRLELLPRLEREYNPRLAGRLVELAALLRRDNELLENLAAEVLLQTEREDGFFFFPDTLLRRAHPALLSRALLTALRIVSSSGEDITARHIVPLLEIPDTSRFLSWDLPGKVTATRDGRGLMLFSGKSSRRTAAGSFSGSLSVPGSFLVPGAGIRLSGWIRMRWAAFDPRQLPELPWRAALDWEQVHPPLTVRSRRPGDRFRPLGAGGERKLKEILIDEKIARPQRDLLPVVCDSKGIVWIAGLRPAHRCRVTGRSSKLLFLRAGPREAGESRVSGRQPPSRRGPGKKAR